MENSTLLALVAAMSAGASAIAAWVALWPARNAAKAAIAQTDIQRELMEQNAQPYVWADIQPDPQQGSFLQLVLGNAGPTMARNVRVVIEPPITGTSGHSSRYADVAQKRLQDGILSLAPGREIRWSLGLASELLKDENEATIYQLSVTAEGPYGELDPSSFYIRTSDWRESSDAPQGSLHLVRNEIEKLVKVIKDRGSS